MKTSESIEIDFKNAENQAKSAEECAEALKKAAAQLRGIMQELHAGWKGEAAEVYLDKCEALAQEIGRSSGNMSRISESIFETARAFYKAEKAALEAVNTISRK